MPDREPSPGELADRLTRQATIQAATDQRLTQRLDALPSQYVLQVVADERQRRLDTELLGMRDDLRDLGREMREGQAELVSAIAAKEAKRQQIMLVVLGALLAAGGSVIVLLLQAGLVK